MNSPHAAKLIYAAALATLADRPVAEWHAALGEIYHPDVLWHGPHPINAHKGAQAVLSAYWQPLLHALPDLERHDDILIAGNFNGGAWVGATGYYTGTFANAWLGIPANGGILNVRFGEFSRIESGRVCEVYLILDILDVLRQAGRWPRGLPLSPGVVDRVPGPSSDDGTALTKADAADSTASLQLVEAMIKGLMRYDRQTLESMGMTRFWSQNMMWYGPAGTGSTRGLKGFEQYHQIPFLKGFSDRKGGNHVARFGDAKYTCSTGWPSIYATHNGDDWMGIPATNKKITISFFCF